MQRILPKKSLFRVRAHINPLSKNKLPLCPHHSYVDWRRHFPNILGGTQEQNLIPYCNTDKYPSFYDTPREYSLNDRKIDMIDIGCGYGGLLFSLAPLFPSKLILGLEIRQKVVDYAAEKIRGYRTLYPKEYDHISITRTNTMKNLCGHLPKGSLEKIFICFPDPHFKPKTFKRRIISTGFLSEYAFLLRSGGRLYCVTDVEELHQWHSRHLREHDLFEEIEEGEGSQGREGGARDKCVELMLETEEGRKVTREGRTSFWTVFQRKP